jgi:hypothetical protein
MIRVRVMAGLVHVMAKLGPAIYRHTVIAGAGPENYVGALSQTGDLTLLASVITGSES